MKRRLVAACSMGNCVHVAGAIHFLDQAKECGYDTFFLGPAISVEQIIQYVKDNSPYMMDVGYRLTPANVIPLVKELKEQSRTLKEQPVWVFGGTRLVAEKVRKLGFFDKIFDSQEDVDDVYRFLRHKEKEWEKEVFPDTLGERINQKYPYPILRHHFGLPSFDETVKGVRKIAESGVLDVISLGTDQNTQQYYFNPDMAESENRGAGGVPVQNAEEFMRLREAADCGNHPLMRCYSGTSNLVRMSGVLNHTIANAWAAIPLSWYDELDGRGSRTLEEAIRENMEAILWHAERGIPVEINEAHHWGLRDAHDTISVVMSYISAYVAKSLGVREYIAQYMFNIPHGVTPAMDLARVLAQIELTESLADGRMKIYREVRAGLPFLSGNMNVAKGQLAASTSLAMTVHPHIIHVVGYSEAEQAATPEVVIESCQIVRGVIRSTLCGNVNAALDHKVQRRKEELLQDAGVLLSYIRKYYRNWCGDPFANPDVLADCIRRGVLDAPHIVKNQKFTGNISTKIVDGACVCCHPDSGREISESERIRLIPPVYRNGVARM